MTNSFTSNAIEQIAQLAIILDQAGDDLGNMLDNESFRSTLTAEHLVTLRGAYRAIVNTENMLDNTAEEMFEDHDTACALARNIRNLY